MSCTQTHEDGKVRNYYKSKQQIHIKVQFNASNVLNEFTSQTVQTLPA